MLSIVVKYFKEIVARPIFFYLFCFIIISPFLNYSEFKSNVVNQTMNRFGPQVNYFKDFAEFHEHYDPIKLSQCIHYFQRVVDNYPFERFAAYSMLGFCQELSGNSRKALRAYQSALSINPNDFWAYYNLGVIQYKEGNYSQAFDSFKHSLETDLKQNLYTLYRSKVYTDVRLSDPEFVNYDYVKGLEEGRLSAYVYLMASKSILSNQGFNVPNNLNPRVRFF